MLALQQTLGNRAVCRMVESGPVIQRRLAFQAKDLDKSRSRLEATRGVVTQDTFSSLKKLISAYHKNKVAKDDLFYVDAIIVLCKQWTAKHGAETGKSAQDKLATIRRLESAAEDARAECLRDASKRRAEEIYLNQARAGGLDAMSTYAGDAFAAAGRLGAGETRKPAGENQAALDLIRKFGLTEAETAAIKTYVVSDYVYINPATANSDSWMKQQTTDNERSLLKDKDLKSLKEQGSLHAGMMMKAMSKMGQVEGGKWAGSAYRGQRLSPEQFAAKYKPGQEFKFDAFSSTSRSESASQLFANGMGGNTPPGKDQTVSVMLYLTVTNARDIKPLAAVQVENEVLLLPGATFIVETVSEDDQLKGTLGSKTVPATAWKKVTAKQIK